jgi:phosphatidylserine/phosphatidylglycerophosphate/cardiolipin synthase-like enzyme
MAKHPRRRSKKSLQNQLKHTVQGLFQLVLIGGVVLIVSERLGVIDVDWRQIYQQSERFVKEQLYKFYRPPRPAVEPVSGDWYRLYFTTPRYPDIPAKRVNIIEQGLIEVINSAQQRLDMAIYGLNLARVAEAIRTAHERGVQVRIVTDSERLKEQKSLQWLQRQQIPLVEDHRSAIMHNKFVVVDQHAVWTGSWNFTVNGTFRNNNHAIYIESTKLAENYTNEFEEMFIHRAFGPSSPSNTLYPRIQLGDNTLIETCFGPEDACAEQLTQHLHQAQRDIKFMVFSFAHDALGQAMLTRARAGVTVTGIFETNGSETRHSEYGRLKRQRLDVVQDGNPYLLHHKIMILDEQTVVLGSFNFSHNADRSNDENLLIIHNTELAAQFLAEFERLATEARHRHDRF